LRDRKDLSWYEEKNDRGIEEGAIYQERRELSLCTGISNPRAEEGATLMQRKERLSHRGRSDSFEGEREKLPNLR
jgi:hypothetical protein